MPFQECAALSLLPPSQTILKCGKQMSILTGYCVTVDEETNILEVGECMYNFITTDKSFYKSIPNINVTNSMCGILHRTGTLCGKCQDGYSPLAYSYEMKCIKCPNGKSNWWKFLLAAFLPLTIFYIIILFFKINVVSSRFQGFLFYSQMISLPAMVRLYLILNYSNKKERETAQIAAQSLSILYGIWNLDFFRSTKKWYLPRHGYVADHGSGLDCSCLPPPAYSDVIFLDTTLREESTVDSLEAVSDTVWSGKENVGRTDIAN
jgi:hypothetical protein